MSTNTSHTFTVTADNFTSEVKGSELPVVVDVWAEWCGPCKMVAPVLEEIARDNQQRLRIGKLNAEDFPELAQELQVLNIPSLIIFSGGEEAHRIIGAKSKAAILREFDAHIPA